LSLFNELKRRNVFKVGAAYVVVAWLIIQVVDVVINNIGAPDWVFRVILLLLAIGLPIILLFAWAFEMTPEGLKREKQVDRSESITNQTGRKLDFMIIGVLLLGLGYFAIDKFVLSAGRSTGPAETQVNSAEGTDATAPAKLERSIAVLPLANRSAREDDQYFADGMHDDLLTQLAKITSLKVISRTSVMRYRDTELSIPEIAKQLGVTAILEGGVQRSGDQIRVNMQLIDAETDEHLWAETYDRQMTAENLFAIQSSITRQITEALKASLSPEEAARIDERPTDNLEAFQEYMKGQQLLALRTVPALEEGKSHFERAIELDPGFAAAKVGLANAYHLLFEYAGWPEADSLEPAMLLLGEALELSPDLGEAFMVRGEIHRHHDDLDAAAMDFERAMELSPGNATLYHWFSFVREAQGRDEEAYVLLQRAHKLDPMSRVIHVAYAIHPFYEGHDAEALAELERVRTLHPDYPAVYSFLSWIYWSQGNAVESFRASLKVFELDPENTRARVLCYNYLNLAVRESALDCITKSQVMKPMEKAFIRILLQLASGDHEGAQAILDSTADFEDDSQSWHYAALYIGDFEQARPGFEKEYPEWFSGPVPDVLKDYQIDDAVDAALLLQQSGENERAENLLRVALGNISRLQRNRGANAFGFLDVKIYALLGQREQALSALEECANIEYLSGWPGLKFLPHYESIRDDPRFTAALARLSAAAELANKRAVSEGLL
jgi:TolB-like protein/Tfp pilus assembly protein PilF